MTALTVLKSFSNNIQKYKDAPCFRVKEKGQWRALSWTEVGAEVRAVSSGLQAIGLQKGERVAVFCSTRHEWTLADMGILSLGAITVPIYHSNTAEEAAYILNNSEASFVFTEEGLAFHKIVSVQNKIPSLRKILIIGHQEAAQDDTILTLDGLKKIGAQNKNFDWQTAINQVKAQDTASIVYTSGTTGPPKGVVLTHANFAEEADACFAIFPFVEKMESLFFLPLAHILARAIQFFQLSKGFVHIYAESTERVVDNMVETHPEFIVSVPRIFEKIHERTYAQVKTYTPWKQAVFHWAVTVGGRWSDTLRAGKRPSLFLSLQMAVARLLVFRRIMQRLGSKLQFAISGGAPLSQELGRFFHAVGFLLLNGYGLTETTAAINCNTVEDFKFGPVGKALPGVEEKIAEDGEILIRGPTVFKEYFNNPEATAEALDPDGWFHTGDIGRIDEEGFLWITDRKKDLIVTASGKKVAPQNIESLLMDHPLIEQAVVIGDNHKYLVALFTLNEENAKHLSPPESRKAVQTIIDSVNAGLASYESIRRFIILGEQFTVDGGELTPTLKVRRKIVAGKYKEMVEQLYRE